MSISLAVALIVVPDLALIATLAYVMSRAALLSPHRATSAERPVELAARQLRPAPRRHSRTYQTPTPSRTHTGSTSDRIEPARKSEARIKAVRSL